MKTTPSEIRDQIRACFEEHYLPKVQEQLVEQHARMLLIFDYIRDFEAKRNQTEQEYQSVAAYEQGLQELIRPMWAAAEEEQCFTNYEALEKALQDLFDGFPALLRQAQLPERFNVLPEDSGWLKTIKFCKRTLLALHRLPVHLQNLRRKPPVKVRYWKHQLPVKNLTIKYFQIDHFLKLKEVDDTVFRSISAAYLRIKRWEEAVVTRQEEGEEDVESLATFLQDFAQKAYEEARQHYEAAFEAVASGFDDAFLKAGTLEYNNQILSDEAILKSWHQAEKKWSTHRLGWKNTIFALFEEWRSDLDIYALRYQTLAALTDFQRAQIKRFGEQIGPEVQEIDQMISEMKPTATLPESDLRKHLTKIIYQTKKQLDQVLVPKLTKKLSSQYILNLIAKLEINVQKSIEGLSREHVVVKTQVYDHPLEMEELQHISPYELIAFETLGFFQNDLSVVKKGLFETLEQVTEQVADIDHIITFNLQAALSLLDEDKEASEKSSEVALEGLERAQIRLRESKQMLDENLLAHGEQVAQVIAAFCDRILELTENENIRELKSRINKARAAKLREERKKEAKLKYARKKEQFLSYFRRKVDQAEDLLEDLSSRLLLTPHKRLIEKEVSDLLVDSRSIIEGLPLVYQRLYNIEPLQDLELFEGRQAELHKLQEAYTSWEQGRFAATIVFGEKWGGQTSFITYALKTSGFSCPLIRYSVSKTIQDESELLDMLRELFKKDHLQSLEEVRDYLNNGQRRIVVLEDLQNLFLRTIGGFSGMQLLLQFINQTCREVFWITTTTLYSWQYLSKTIAIHEFFSYPIQMQSLSDEQITSIIWKRNRISGYKIQFLPSAKRKEDKKFKNLNEEAQQLTLKRDFFTSLNAFANSNISLALIFWLHATKEVKGNTLIMGEFRKPDFSFMNVLSPGKIHTLNALIIHDGLTEGQLAAVLNVSNDTLKMTLLSLIEDGILFTQETNYMVNPMLYRNAVAMLRDKNLIH